MVTRVLILGGTAEAADLARRLADRADLAVVTSLAGRTRSPRRLPGQVRSGGFGGAAGLAEWLGACRIDRVVDATHPFAAWIAREAAEACRRAGVPLLKLARPAWKPEPGDRWLEVDSAADAAAALPDREARVFLTVGRQSLAPFAVRPALWFLVRLVDPPDSPLPLGDHEAVTGRGPFDLAGERDLLARHRIGWLVSKNSGGGGTAKLLAARERELPVVMIRQPLPPPAVLTVEDPMAAGTWLTGGA